MIRLILWVVAIWFIVGVFSMIDNAYSAERVIIGKPVNIVTILCDEAEQAMEIAVARQESKEAMFKAYTPYHQEINKHGERICSFQPIVTIPTRLVGQVPIYNEGFVINIVEIQGRTGAIGYMVTSWPVFEKENERDTKT